MGLKEIIWRAVDLIDMAQRSDGMFTFSKVVINPRVDQDVRNFLTS
jgi:hypothetical protein